MRRETVANLYIEFEGKWNTTPRAEIYRLYKVVVASAQENQDGIVQNGGLLQAAIHLWFTFNSSIHLVSPRTLLLV